MATKAQTRIAELEAQLEAEVKRRTEADSRARTNLRYRDIAHELAKRVLAYEQAPAPDSKKSG